MDFFLICLASLSILVLWVAQFVFRQARHRLALSAIPKASGDHWLLGHKYILSHDATNGFRKALQNPTARRIVRFHLGPITWVGLLHPDTAAVMLKSREPKGPSYVKEVFRPWLGESIGFANGQKWMSYRRLLRGALSADIVRNFHPVYRSATGVLVDKWRAAARDGSAGTTVDVTQDSTLLAFDIALRCAVGFELDVQTQHCDYVSWVQELSKMALNRLAKPHYLFSDFLYYHLGPGQRFLALSEKAQTFCNQLISERREIMGAAADSGDSLCTDDDAHVHTRSARYRSAGNHTTFVEAIVNLNAKENMTDTDICQEINSLLFAGVEPSSKWIQWTLYMLAKHPDVAAKCRQEVVNVLGELDEITYEMLNEFRYVTQVIKETMRFVPILPGFMRILTSDYEIEGFRVPKGTAVFVPIPCLFHHPEVWDQPDVFDPDNFAPGRESTRSPYAFAPFSAGPRNCLGQRMSMDEIRYVIAELVRRFELSIPDDAPEPKPFATIFTGAKPNIILRIAPTSA